MLSSKTYDDDFPSLSSGAKQLQTGKLNSGKKAIKAGPRSAPSDPTSLVSLPDELLIKITLLTNELTALALARVSKRLSYIADHLIWRELLLSAPVSQSHTSQYGGLGRVLHGISQGLIEKKEAEKGGRRRAMVRSVTIVPRAYANKEMVKILSLVSQNLRSLTVERPNDPSNEHTAGSDTFDYHVFHANLTFPVLRTLTLGPTATRYPHFTPYLSSLAPELVTLKSDIQASRLTQKDLPSLTFPRSTSTTGIRYLRISRSDSAENYQKTYLTTNLSLFPDLRTLFVDLPAAKTVLARPGLTHEKRQRARCQLLGQLGKLEHLENFIWDVSPADFLACMALVEPGFGCLRRLVLGSVKPADLFSLIPILPVLEDLYFYASSDIPPVVAKSPARPRPDVAEGIDPKFASILRASPHLRVLHQLGTPAGVDFALPSISNSDTIITSVRHGSAELLLVKSRSTPSSVRVAMADFNGKVVPLEVVQEMKLADGKKGEEWKGRGINVGNEAWAVLTRWDEGQKL